MAMMSRKVYYNSNALRSNETNEAFSPRTVPVLKSLQTLGVHDSNLVIGHYLLVNVLIKNTFLFIVAFHKTRINRWVNWPLVKGILGLFYFAVGRFFCAGHSSSSLFTEIPKLFLLMKVAGGVNPPARDKYFRAFEPHLFSVSLICSIFY